jgi:Ca-activated chloride channel family protein
MRPLTLRPSAILLLALAGCTQHEANMPSSASAPVSPEESADASVAVADAALSPHRTARLQTSNSEYTYGSAPTTDRPAVIHSAPVAAAAPAPPQIQYGPRTGIDFEGLDEVSEDSAMIGPAPRGDLARMKSSARSRESFGGVGSRGSGIGGGGSVSGMGNYAGGTAFSAPSASQRAPLPAPAAQQPNTEDYTNYGFGGLTLTADDRLSTFSVDVDTASYAIARRKLNNGQLPPISAVRVEEFVNAMPFTYAPPADGAPFAVHMEAAPSPFAGNHHVLRIGVKGKEIDASERKPVRLTFLVDTSGSMQSPDKIQMAKRSLHFLVDQLNEEDSVALATYAGSVSKVLGPTSLSEKARVHAAIENLTAGGSTAMNSGIDLAYRMARESYVPGAENRVIVLSDGDANVGPSTHQDILKTIRRSAEQGITLSTIGFGMGNYKDTMMEQLANKGDGNYFYIDQFAEAQKVFGEKLAGTIQTIARDVKIQVEFNPAAVTSYRLLGYENRDIADKDFRNDVVDAGEVGSGHTITALYDVVLNPTVQGESLATVRIRNKKPGPDSPAVEWSTPFTADALAPDFSSASKDLRIALGVASFAELLRGSPYANEVTYAALWNLVNEAARSGVSEDTELLGLVAMAARLSGEGGLVAMP